MSTLEQKKEIALDVSRAIQNGEWDKLDKLLDENFTYTGDGLHFNKNEYMGFMQDMTLAFTSLKMEFTHVLVDDDQVTIKFISRAVNTGSFMGAPANKKNIEVQGINIRKIKDGKVVQEWQTTDLLGVMRQIGFGALLGYAIFVGLFKVEQKPAVRKSAEEMKKLKAKANRK